MYAFSLSVGSSRAVSYAKTSYKPNLLKMLITQNHHKCAEFDDFGANKHIRKRGRAT